MTPRLSLKAGHRRAYLWTTSKKTIADLIKRKYAAADGSAERRMAVRQLTGLRYSYEEAGGIIEDRATRKGRHTSHSTLP